VGDAAAAIDQHTDLATGLGREGRQMPCELVGDQALGRHPAPREALELADLASFEAVGIAEDLDGVPSTPGGPCEIKI
jgi:hypothetical protein